MLLYLRGFAYGPSSTKARAFGRYFAARGLRPVVPALDEGDFTHLTLSGQLRLVAQLAAGRRPLVLMAPAVDFARRWRERLGEVKIERWRREGEVEHHALGRRVPLRFDLMADAERHEPWPRVAAPALVLQGRRDDVVPLERVARWTDEQPQARRVVYDAGHELTECLDEMLDEARRFLLAVPGLVQAFPGLEHR